MGWRKLEWVTDGRNGREEAEGYGLLGFTGEMKREGWGM